MRILVASKELEKLESSSFYLVILLLVEQFKFLYFVLEILDFFKQRKLQSRNLVYC